jgi:serine/threonine-protein kinase
MDPASLVGRVVGHCRLVQPVARGSMGLVFRAEHQGLGRIVAVKVLEVAPGDSAAAEKLLLEARALAKIEHRNVVQVYDVGLAQGLFYLVMQFLDGPTLKQRVEEVGRLPLEEALDLVAGIARGLGAMHARGLVHRDLKMENVMTGADGVPRITDFGLALAARHRDPYAGHVVGTLPYIAPELWRGEPAGVRSDLYALGILVYALATGRFPFRAPGPKEYAELHLKYLPKSPQEVNPEVGEELSAVIAKAMAKKPAERYRAAEAFLEDLARAREGRAPDAVTETGRKVKCGFCESLNPSKAARCEVCGEDLSQASGDLGFGLRPDEMECPLCKGVMPRSARVCPKCAKGVCLKCRKAPIVAGNFCARCAPPAKR